jgi:hypothetical protein
LSAWKAVLDSFDFPPKLRKKVTAMVKNEMKQTDIIVNRRLQSPEYSLTGEMNYIDIKNKTLVVSVHKNKRAYGTIITDLDDKFIDIVKPVLNYLKDGVKFWPMFNKSIKTPNRSAEYSTPEGVSRMLFKHTGYLNHKIRDAKTSLVLYKGNAKAVDALQKYQMHSLETMLKHYTKHGAEAINDGLSAEESD